MSTASNKKRKRPYSPRVIEKMRSEADGATRFESLVRTDPANQDKPATSGRHAGQKKRKPVDGFGKQDLERREGVKERYAAARRKAKTRGGKLLFD